MRLTMTVLGACSVVVLAGCSDPQARDVSAPVPTSESPPVAGTPAIAPTFTAPAVASPIDVAGQPDHGVTRSRPATTLLQTSSPGDASGLLPVQGLLGVSERGCVTLTDRIERIVVVSADGRLSADGLRVLIPGEKAFIMGEYIDASGWTKRDLKNLSDDLVPRAARRCEPGPYVFLDPT